MKKLIPISIRGCHIRRHVRPGVGITPRKWAEPPSSKLSHSWYICSFGHNLHLKDNIYKNSKLYPSSSLFAENNHNEELPKNISE